MRDFRGKQIKVGATVVYPCRQSSRMWMVEGVVESVEDERVRVRQKGGQRPGYPALRRIAVVE